VKTSASCQGKKVRRVAHASIVSSSPYLKELQEAKQTTLRGASVKRKLLKSDSERKITTRYEQESEECSASWYTKQLGEDVAKSPAILVGYVSAMTSLEGDGYNAYYATST
jgi:hypothetical protein